MHVLPHGIPFVQCLEVVDTDGLDEMPISDSIGDEYPDEPSPLWHSLSLDIQLLPHYLPCIQFLAFTLFTAANIKIKTRKKRFMLQSKEFNKRIPFPRSGVGTIALLTPHTPHPAPLCRQQRATFLLAFCQSPPLHPLARQAAL